MVKGHLTGCGLHWYQKKINMSIPFCGWKVKHMKNLPFSALDPSSTTTGFLPIPHFTTTPIILPLPGGLPSLASPVLLNMHELSQAPVRELIY